MASDYNLLLTRPLVDLAIASLLFSGSYAIFWAATGKFGRNDTLKSIEMVASRLFPFGAFEDVSTGWFEKLATRVATTGWVIFARAMASVQSLISLVLIFLFGLAMRRRFQIGG